MGKGKDRYQANRLQLRRGDDLDSIINSNLGFVDGEIIIVKDRKTVVCVIDDELVDITTGETVHHIEKSEPTIKEKAIKKERTAIFFLFVVLFLSCLAGIGVVLAILAHPLTNDSKTTIFIMCAFLCMSAFVDGILFQNL